MSDETVLTPIAPEEGVSAPPKVTPSSMAAAPSAPTVKLKPVIRKPLIRKPVIGGAKPVTLKPASGTPPPPAAVPEAVAEAPAPAAPAENPAEAQPKSTTSPIAAQAVLRKTGIVAEGILTPAQAQAAKTKTSRISLESAIGVAPPAKSAAPMKTIRLRRPTDIPPAPGAAKPVLSPLKPVVPAAAPAAPAAEAEPAPASAPVAEAPAASAPVADAAPAVADNADGVSAATTVAASAEPSTTVTQKKTLKLRRPNFKRPTVGGLRAPGATAAAVPAEDFAAPQVADMDSVADIPAVADIPEIKPRSAAEMAPAAGGSESVAGAPAWLNVVTLVTGLAALVVIGLCTWSLYSQAVGPEAGPNGLASFYSETDHSR